MSSSTDLYLTLFTLFIVGSLFGWIYEYLIDGDVNYNLDLKVPFLFVYGIGLVLVYLLYHLIKDMNVCMRIIIYAISLTILEYVVGVLSYQYNKKHTWKYDNNRKISVKATIVWVVLALIAEYFFRYMNI